MIWFRTTEREFLPRLECVYLFRRLSFACCLQLSGLPFARVARWRAKSRAHPADVVVNFTKVCLEASQDPQTTYPLQNVGKPRQGGVEPGLRAT